MVEVKFFGESAEQIQKFPRLGTVMTLKKVQINVNNGFSSLQMVESTIVSRGGSDRLAVDLQAWYDEYEEDIEVPIMLDEELPVHE